jgi:hypothetical protein
MANGRRLWVLFDFCNKVINVDASITVTIDLFGMLASFFQLLG